MGKILCVGLAVVDIVTRCDEYPLEDSDVRCESIRIQRGGNASNNCTILRQFKCNCEYLGTLGDDWIAKFIIQDMDFCGINYSHCLRHRASNINSPCSTVILNSSTGSRTIRHHNPNLPELQFIDFKAIIDTLCLNEYDWIHFEGRRKNLNEIVRMLQYLGNANDRITGQRGPLISVEVEKPSLELGPALLPLPIDIFFVSKDYAKSMGYADMKNALLGIRLQQLEFREKLKIPGPCKSVLVITWGEMGSSALIPSPPNANDPDIYIPCLLEEESTNSISNNSQAIPVVLNNVSSDDIVVKGNGNSTKAHVVDTLGAGDTFIATFIHSYLKLSTDLGGDDKKEKIVKAVLRYANYVAGQKCRHIGLTDIPIDHDLVDFLS